MRNRIESGNNLDIMRRMEGECVNLICTDPPFNSNENYNVTTISRAQKQAFEDTWKFDPVSNREDRNDIKERAKTDNVYKAIDNALTGYDHLFQFKTNGYEGAIRSYLTFIAPRLAEAHRILKSTGSIYLHCDPSASHYLKGLMDTVFGKENFRNEIIWHYNKYTNALKAFQRNHDVILFYTKTDNYVFNTLYGKMSENQKKIRERGYNTGSHGGKKYLMVFDKTKPKVQEHIESGKYYTVYYIDNPKDGVALADCWNDITRVTSNSKQRTGYPTQKPLKLYQRMIEASSNKEDIVFDMFCGSGTTLVAAQSLGRKWIGIDITGYALKFARSRLLKQFNLKPGTDYDTKGEITNMEEVRLLLDQEKYHEVANSLVSRLDLEPTDNIGDGGFDGIGLMDIWDIENSEFRKEKILAEVKTGQASTGHVRDFCHAMTENKATAGVFIILKPPSSGMKEIAERMGTFRHNGRDYNRLQFWHVLDLDLQDKIYIESKVKLPPRIKEK